MENSPCPYCGGDLPPPTRKRLCPHCGKTIVVRTRPDQKPAWVREEDIPIISKEWTDEMLKRDIEQQRKTGIEGLGIARHNIRQWVMSGVVKSLKIYSAQDGSVCETCKQMNGKVFPIATREQISFFMDNAHVKNCQNPVGCRCYWCPEEVTIG